MVDKRKYTRRNSEDKIMNDIKFKFLNFKVYWQGRNRKRVRNSKCKKKTRKNVALRIDPWMIPALIENDLEEWPLKTIFIPQSDKKDWII